MLSTDMEKGIRTTIYMKEVYGVTKDKIALTGKSSTLEGFCPTRQMPGQYLKFGH
jgi:hypothetical protein